MSLADCVKLIGITTQRCNAPADMMMSLMFILMLSKIALMVQRFKCLWNRLLLIQCSCLQKLNVSSMLRQRFVRAFMQKETDGLDGYKVQNGQWELIPQWHLLPRKRPGNR